MSVTDARGTVTTYAALTQADELAAAGKLDAAAQRVIEHLRRHPDEPQGLAKLGELAMLLGGLGQAEQFLRRAILRGARQFEVRRNLASVLNQQERLGEACAMFDALAKERDDPTISALHGLTLDKLGRNDEARAILEKLVTRHPTAPTSGYPTVTICAQPGASTMRSLLIAKRPRSIMSAAKPGGVLPASSAASSPTPI